MSGRKKSTNSQKTGIYEISISWLSVVNPLGAVYYSTKLLCDFSRSSSVTSSQKQGYTNKGLFHANLLHTLLELFPVTDGTILDFGAIIIDSVHRIVKELGNLRTVLDAQTDKGKDTEGGG